MRVLLACAALVGATAFSGASIAAQAQPVDTLELRGGTLLKGVYVGGSAGTVRFQTTQGTQVLDRKEVLALTFGEVPAAAAEPATPPAAPPATAPTGPVTVAAGSLLLVRMVSQASSDDAVGKKFEARLEADLVVGNRVVAEAGSKIYGEVVQATKARRLRGKSTLQLGLTQIDARGKLYPIKTSNFAEAGPSSFRKTARNAAVGAAVGAAFDGSDGAKKGAGVGLAASVLTRGTSIVVPPNAVLEFRLTQPLAVQ